MSAQYMTPARFRRWLEDVLRQADFADAVCTKPRYVVRDERECLEAGVFRYSSTRMPLETLEAYERALAGRPGVLTTRIIHDDSGTLRDQVVVTHLRCWNEPEFALDPEAEHLAPEDPKD